jgi:hypothetical protein
MTKTTRSKPSMLVDDQNNEVDEDKVREGQLRVVEDEERG